MRISDWSSDVCSSDLKIIDALDRLLGEMADDPGHPLRLKIEDSLAELAFDLQHDPAMRDRVFRLKAEMLDNPAIERWWMSMWEQMRRGLIGLRSEEHTSELQSLMRISYAVFCLKKKHNNTTH